MVVLIFELDKFFKPVFPRPTNLDVRVTTPICSPVRLELFQGFELLFRHSCFPTFIEQLGLLTLLFYPESQLGIFRVLFRYTTVPLFLFAAIQLLESDVPNFKILSSGWR